MTLRHSIRFLVCLACLFLARTPCIALGFPTAPVESPRSREQVLQDGYVRTSGSMQITVRLPDGVPAAGARLLVNVGTKDKSFDTLQNYHCDQQGRVEIDLPTTLDLLRIWVEAKRPGYVPLFGEWLSGRYENDERIPPKFTFHLPKGTTIGGAIADPAGKPIAGVEVEVSLDLSSVRKRSRARPTDSWNDGRSTTTSDANGRWSFDWIPAGEQIGVEIKLSHPDFISDQSSSELQSPQGVMMAALRDQTATFVMQPGGRLLGLVHDAEENPIAGAIVLRGDGGLLDRKSKVLTDQEGHFELPPVKSDDPIIAIFAKGWMPVLKAVETGSEVQTLDVQLVHGRQLRLKFVDSEGQPIPNVRASLTYWLAPQANAHFLVMGSRWPFLPYRANEAGVYDWNWAPDDPLAFRASAKGFASEEFTVTADGTTQTIVLNPPLNVTGTITNAKTGEPIPQATVMQVRYSSLNLLHLNRSEAVTARDGQLKMVFHRTDARHGIRIECPGYRTRQFGPWEIGDKNPVLEIEMEPAEPIEGVVVNQNGAPVKNASVYLVTETQALNWSRRDGLGNDSFKRSTDAKGHFSFPAQFEPYLLIAATKNGYTEIHGRSGSVPKRLKLKPYARIEGRVLEAGQPIVEQQVILSAIRPADGPAANVDGDLWTRTDNEGRYVFENVPPVASSIRPYFSIWRDYKIHAAESIPLDLQPGQHLTIDLNAGGRDVTGRVKLTGDVPGEMNLNWSLNYLVARKEGITPPQSLIKMGLTRGTLMTDSLASTPEGKAFRQTLHHYFVKLNPDGTFRISGVAPGEYHFFLNIYEPPGGGCLVNPIASRKVAINVPESGEGAVDLGEIRVKAIPALHPGEFVPDIAFQTPTGETGKISDFRGEYLLVDVWATWCAPCVAALPKLEALHDRHGEELRILGLNVDSNAVRVKAFLKERNLAWPQGITNDPSALMTTLGVSSTPTYLLIDPSGRLVRKAVRLSDLEAVFRKLESY